MSPEAEPDLSRRDSGPEAPGTRRATHTDGISIRNQLLLVTGTVIVATALAFATGNYRTQRRALLSGIDQKLLVSAHLAAAVPPKGYIGRITDKSSVSEKEYLEIVDAQNRLCEELGLQYLWSCMVLGEDIVFTTATSPSKDVGKMDHAAFLDVHRDPAAFDGVFGRMETDFSSFHNEWGHGRMVLVPFRDENGRPYCVGASVSIDVIGELLGATLWRSTGLGLVILLLGLAAAFLLSRSLSQPIERLTTAADGIAHGDMGRSIDVGGSAELKSLARSLEFMRNSIRKTIHALKVEIHERRAAEAKLRENRDNLESIVRHRTEALQRSNRELEQFAYVASHDLQEPLRKITAFGDRLSQKCGDAMPEEGRDYANRMRNAAHRMHTLIEDLLALSRVTTGARPFSSVDMNRVARQVVSDLDTKISETHARVEIGELPTVLADETQMYQLVQNLVSNALKFRKPDTAPQVVVRPGRTGDRAGGGRFHEIVVSDGGIGFDPKHSDRIFGVFQRLHARHEYEGSGIGLALCRKIVDRHGGTVTVDSSPGSGAIFIVRLPKHPPGAAETDA